jgi:hypothetical protein
MDADEASRIRVFRHDKTAVCFGFDDGETHAAVGFHQRPVSKVAAGALRTTLDDVPGHDASRHVIPIGRGPSELKHHRRERDSGIGDATGDNHVSAAFERLYDSSGTKIRICRKHARPDVRERLSRIHIDERFAR